MDDSQYSYIGDTQSPLFQALRQKEREEADDVRHQLDQELDAIRGLLSGPDHLSESLERKLSSQPDDVAGEDRDRQYDQFVRELVFDQRSKPKDRSKTEEELALEAKLALEKAERQRIRRMNGEDSAESSGEEERPVKRRRLIGGDDLEDDFDDDADNRDGLGRGLISSSDSIGEEDSFVDDGRKEDSESEDETGADHDSEPPWCGLGSPNLSGAERKAHQGPKSSHELPYTFPCPSSHEEFLDILGGVVDQDVPIVVERIRALHHPSLGAENSSKLQVSIDVVVAHILLHVSKKACRCLQAFSLTIFSM
jgi:nucleolar protein 14